MSAKGEAAYAKHVATRTRTFKPWSMLPQSIKDKFEPKPVPKKRKAKKAKAKE